MHCNVKWTVVRSRDASFLFFTTDKMITYIKISRINIYLKKAIFINSNKHIYILIFEKYFDKRILILIQFVQTARIHHRMK